MKKLDVSAISAGVAMPIKSGTLQFLQDAHQETTSALFSLLVENPVADTVYIISGCQNSTVAPNYTLSAGYLYVNGEVFQFDGATFTTTGLQKAYAKIVTTQFVTNADPVEFSDSVLRNVHNIRKISIENTTVFSTLGEFEDFIDVSLIKKHTNDIVDIYRYLPKNRGYVGNIDIGAGSPSYTIGGDTVAVVSDSSGSGTSIFTVEFANEMPNMNYMVKPFMEVESGIISQAAGMPIISKIDTTHFQLAISESLAFTQDLRLNYEIISLD